MIISHKYKFIFIKTYKTAGTSIEIYLAQQCVAKDIVTPINPPVGDHRPRNFKGYWNPFPEIILNRDISVRETLKQLYRRRRFYNHIPARVARYRVPEKIWNSYFKFCVERNPWDKTLSHYHMLNVRSGVKSIEEYFQRRQFCLNIHLYTDDHGDLLVDKVVKYEELDKELFTIFDSLGIPFEGSLGIQAKSEYRSERKSFKEVLTDSQIAIINNIFENEIIMHNYTIIPDGEIK